MNLPAEILNELTIYLTERFSAPCAIFGTSAISGGCIHQALRLDSSLGPFFLKWNEAGEAGNFLAEQRGLQLLARHCKDFTVKPINAGSAGDFSYLLLEFIEEGRPPAGFWRDFGERLAALHRNTAPVFGLDHDNVIGRLPQSNRQHPDFVTFFIEERIIPQAERAWNMNLIGKDTMQMFERLYPALPDLLPREPPALLHGDLWQGNFLCGKNGRPVLIDPAVYYGHREAEVAFTTLFGGFAPEFYDAYNNSFPLAPNWQQRSGLFNLYPLLVHLNLFGGSYLGGIKNVLRSYF